MKTALNIDLAETQKRIQQSLVDPRGATFPSELIRSSKRLKAEEHFAIYQRSYIARLRECMSKQFSALEFALGKELFSQFADGYLKVYPSVNYNLISLGEKFPSYLEQTRPDRDQEEKEDWPDFMIELAKFEYAINIIFEEKSNVDYILATEQTQEELLKLIPVFYLFEYQFPIHMYYTSFANKQNPDLPLPQNTWTAISRHNYKLSIHNLNQGQYYFLKYLKESKDFKDAVDQFLNNHQVSKEVFDSLWPTWKREWMRLGLLSIKSP